MEVREPEMRRRWRVMGNAVVILRVRVVKTTVHSQKYSLFDFVSPCFIQPNSFCYGGTPCCPPLQFVMSAVSMNKYAKDSHMCMVHMYVPHLGLVFGK